MVTIHDVAREAGVSVATVSRVLNNSPLVTTEKTQVVQASIKKLGYQVLRSKAARVSKSRILLVVTSILVDDLFQGIEDTAVKLGYQVLYKYTGVGKNVYARCQDILGAVGDNICGVLLLNVISKDPELRQLFRAHPVVQVGEYHQMDNTSVVLTDDESAGYDITRLLLDQGRRRIAFVSAGMESIHYNADRLKGYRRALREAGLPPDKSLILAADYSIEGGHDAAKKLLAVPAQPDAVCCAVDRIAVGCVQELLRQGVRVPRDVAVTGFDNDIVSECCVPAITTAAQSFDEIGAEAVRTLDMAIQGKLSKDRKIMISHEIIQREST